MKKIVSIAVALLCLTTSFSICFAAENEIVIKKIAKQMIKEKELDNACIKKEKIEPSAAITVDPFILTGTKSTDKVFLVMSKTGPCYMGNSTTALWLYKKNAHNGSYSKIFGVEYPNDIKPIVGHSSHGLFNIDVIYNAGNFNPGIIETYRFDGKKYRLSGKRTKK